MHFCVLLSGLTLDTGFNYLQNALVCFPCLKNVEVSTCLQVFLLAQFLLIAYEKHSFLMCSVL